MAIWQFNIYFIPRQTLLEKYGQVPTQLDFEDALSGYWWLNLNLDISKIYPLLQQFGDLQEWTLNSDGLRSFGNDDANTISVCYDSKTDRVEDLSCRIDLRQIEKIFVDKIFSVAMQFDCLLMDSKGALFQPIITSLVARIKDSDANRFVSDPKQFLDDLSKGIITQEGI
jgi:hypothetical protein